MLNKTTQYLDELPPTEELAKVQCVVNGYKQFQILKTGFDTGLFDWLAEHGPALKADIVTALSLRGAHLSAYLQALCELDCLHSKDNYYSLNPAMAKVLLKDSRWCQVEPIQQLSAPISRWTQLSNFMLETQHQEAGPQYSLTPTLALLCHPLRDEAKQIATRLLQLETANTWHNVLFFDGCNGLVAMFMCEQRPHLSATIVVPETLLESTQQLLANSPAQERCTLLAGTPLTTKVTAQYDLVLANHSLYSERKAINEALENMLQGLNSNATFCAAHWFCLEACDPSPHGLLEMDKAILTDSHPLCGVERFPQRLLDLGLVNTHREDLSSPYGVTKLHFGEQRHAG